MIAFTICRRSTLAYAITLHETFSRQHPEATFYVVIMDSGEGIDVAAFPFTVLSVGELGLPDPDRVTARSTATEFASIAKPFTFQLLFDRHPGSAVLYLDPDIYVVSRFDELTELLEDGVGCVLTPSITEPAEHAEFDDSQILHLGTYNPGFCCLSDTPEVRRITWWWARRQMSGNARSPEADLVVDREWTDLFPAFIESCSLLRHPGYSVGYWNLPQRRLRCASDEWDVNGEPLRFFQFSGSRVEDDAVFTSHSRLLDARNAGPAADLLAEYRRMVIGNAHSHFRAISEARGSGEKPTTSSGWGWVRGTPPLTVPHLSVTAWHARAEYTAWSASASETVEERSTVESASVPVEDTFQLHGFCVICGSEQSFRTSGLHANRPQEDGRVVPNWRENLACVTCGFINRQRAAYHLLRQEMQPEASSRIYLTEFVTDFYRLVSHEYPLTVGSEYLGPDLRGGAIVDGVPHEDLQTLSYEDASFDMIVSLDVLEHVPEETLAFSEMARTLRSGGMLLMTAPTDIGRSDNLVRAVMSPSGETTHLMEPEYHGNPLDPEGGSLCYRYYGWQVLDQLRDGGFSNAAIVTYWSERFRYFGDPQIAILATR